MENVNASCGTFGLPIAFAFAANTKLAHSLTLSRLNFETMVSFETSDLRKIGQGLATFGVIFTLIGVALFFDKGFLAVGNILILSGVILTAGSSLLQFFLKPKNYKGSLPLVCGFLFVITGWPVTGLFFETCGFVFLFREFWPTIANFSRKLPILGSLLRQFCAPPYFAPSRGMRCPV